MVGEIMDTQRIGQEMDAIVTLGNGGYDQLCYQKVPIPKLGRGEVLVKVLAIRTTYLKKIIVRRICPSTNHPP